MNLNVVNSASKEVNAALGISEQRTIFLLNKIITIYKQEIVFADLNGEEDGHCYLTSLLKPLINECGTLEESIFITIKLMEFVND